MAPLPWAQPLTASARSQKRPVLCGHRGEGTPLLQVLASSSPAPPPALPSPLPQPSPAQASTVLSAEDTSQRQGSCPRGVSGTEKWTHDCSVPLPALAEKYPQGAWRSLSGPGAGGDRTVLQKDTGSGHRAPCGRIWPGSPFPVAEPLALLPKGPDGTEASYPNCSV